MVLNYSNKSLIYFNDLFSERLLKGVLYLYVFNTVLAPLSLRLILRGCVYAGDAHLLSLRRWGFKHISLITVGGAFLPRGVLVSLKDI